MLNNNVATITIEPTRRYILRLVHPDFNGENTEIDSSTQENLGRTIDQIVDNNGFLYRRNQLRLLQNPNDVLPVPNENLNDNPRAVFEAIRENVAMQGGIPGDEYDVNELLREFVLGLEERYRNGELDIPLRNIGEAIRLHRELLTRIFVNPGEILHNRILDIENDFLNNFFDLFSADLFERLHNLLFHITRSGSLKSTILYITICLLPAFFRFSYFQFFNYEADRLTDFFITIIQRRQAFYRNLRAFGNINEMGRAFREGIIQIFNANRPGLIENLGAQATPDIPRAENDFWGGLNNRFINILSPRVARWLRALAWPTIGFIGAYGVRAIINRPVNRPIIIRLPDMSTDLTNPIWQEIRALLCNTQLFETVGVVAICREILRLFRRF